MVGHFLDCTLLAHVQLVFTWTSFLPVRTEPRVQVSVLTFAELHDAHASPFPQPDKAHSGSIYPIVYLSNPYFTSLPTRIPWVYSRYYLVSNDPEVEQSVNNFCAAYLWNISSDRNYILKLDIDTINYSLHMLKEK